MHEAALAVASGDLISTLLIITCCLTTKMLTFVVENSETASNQRERTVYT